MEITYGMASPDDHGTHWHVALHSDDDQPLITYGLVSALDCAATEVSRIADSTHEEAHACHENGEWEDSANAFMRAEAQWALAANLANLVRNASEDSEQRAPIYRDQAALGPQWRVAVAHVLTGDPNAEWPDGFQFYSCSERVCRPGVWVLFHGGDFVPPRELSRHRDPERAIAALNDTMRDWAYDAAQGDPDGTDEATVSSMLADLRTDPSRLTREGSLMLTVHADDGATYRWSLTFDPTDDTTED